MTSNSGNDLILHFVNGLGLKTSEESNQKTNFLYIVDRPPEAGPTVAQFLQTLPDYQYEEGESLLIDLLENVARVLTFRDIVNIVMGNAAVFSRIQTPLRQFILRRITDSGRIPIERAVVKLLDDNYSVLEEAVRVASVKEEIDFAETLHKFFEVKLAEFARCILDTNEEQVTSAKHILHQLSNDNV